MRLLVFDNYDSFTYNLVHLVGKITRIKTDVFRNDEISLEEIGKYDKIILSPGPGVPSEAGLLLALIKEYASSKSILGVCLGHQAIGEAFGGHLRNLSTVFHGVATPIFQGASPKGERGTTDMETSRLFTGMQREVLVGRYHSWIVEKDGFPDCLQVTAEDEHGFVMALQHKTFDVQGVQFHPESVLTPDGETILRNWLAI